MKVGLNVQCKNISILSGVQIIIFNTLYVSRSDLEKSDWQNSMQTYEKFSESSNVAELEQSYPPASCRGGGKARFNVATPTNATVTCTAYPRGALNFFQVGVCGPDFQRVGLVN